MKKDLDNLVCFNIYEGWRCITAIHKHVYGNDLTLSMHLLLRLFEVKNTPSINDLSKGMNIDVFAVSALIGRMEKRGLLRREKGKAYRRTVFVTLTKEGKDLKAFFKSKAELFNQIITEGISLSDLETLQRIVVKIEKNRNKLNTHTPN